VRKSHLAMLFAAPIAATLIACGGGKSHTEPPTVPPTIASPAAPVTPGVPTPSSRKPVSAEQDNAARAAQSYLDMQAFSRKGLIKQLSSKAGDQFPEKVAVAAVDSLHVDWNEQAAKAAKGYLELQPMSKKELTWQLESDAGDGFTHAQAVYGVGHSGL